MVDVPNLSLLTSPEEKVEKTKEKEKEKETVPPQYRLGRIIRDRRVEKGMSLRDLANYVTSIVSEEFTTMALSQIERGMRPAAAAELWALAGALRLDKDELLQAATAWNKAAWQEPSPVVLTPEETKTRTTYNLTTSEMWDELCAVVGDMERGSQALRSTTRYLWTVAPDVASNANLTADLLHASAQRLKRKMDPGGFVQAACTTVESTEIPPGGRHNQ